MSKTKQNIEPSVIVPVTGIYRVGDKMVKLTAGEHALKEAIPRPADDAIRQVAKHTYEEEGLQEIDDRAEISHGDLGAYVQAWVWVNYEDVDCYSGFNPLLEKWLNDRDYATDEWPRDLSSDLIAEADRKFADPPATVLDDLGWPMDNPKEKA